MKKEVLIGILAVAVLVIAGCTQQVRESTTPTQISRQNYGTDYQGILEMFTDAKVVYFLPDTLVSQECRNICIDNGGECVAAFHEYWSGNANILEPKGCRDRATVGPDRGALYCHCATPPQ